MSNSSTLAHICLEKGASLVNHRTGAFKAVNSLIVHINADQGTELPLDLSVDTQAWVAAQQRIHDEAVASGEFDNTITSFNMNADLVKTNMDLDVAGQHLPMVYHPWREPGMDGHSMWLRACVMCPAMNVLRDYPAVVARAMLWHAYMAKQTGLLMASVTLHIPRLWLMESKYYAGLPESINLSVSPGGQLTPAALEAADQP